MFQTHPEAPRWHQRVAGEQGLGDFPVQNTIEKKKDSHDMRFQMQYLMFGYQRVPEIERLDRYIELDR